MTALAALALFVLQSSLTAWVAASMPMEGQVDGFGNPLCITRDDGAGMGRHAPSPGTGIVPDCCTLACLSGALPLGAPEQSFAEILTPDVGAVGLAAASIVQPRHGAEHDPGSPRAPPATM